MEEIKGFDCAGLNNGQFAIPELDWNTDMPNIISGESSVMAMKTNMANAGLNELMEYVDTRLGGNITPNSVARLVKESIKSFLQKGERDDLINSFHLIQLWGGRAGRMIYLQKVTIDFDKYENFVKVVTSSDDIDKCLNATREFIDATDRLNISFATKHVSLWQQYSNSNLVLPIYDNIMALNIMGRYQLDKQKRKMGLTFNKFDDLKVFWENMIAVANHLNIDVEVIERTLFNFFRNGTPSSWKRFQD